MAEKRKRSTLWTIMITVLCLTAVGSCALVGTLFYLLSGTCGNSALSSIISPDGEHKAVFFSYSCGATDGGSYGVSVVGASERLTDDTDFNVFWVSDGYPKAFNMRWAGPSTLEVTLDQPWTDYNSAGLIGVESQVGPVHVVYRDSIDQVGAENARCCAFGRTEAGRARARSLDL